MDTRNAISAPPTQNSGLVLASPKRDKPSGESTITVATATEPMRETTLVKLPEQKDLNDPENKQKISNAVKEINNFFQMTQRSLGFSMDEASGHMVMQIKDTETNEVIRQIPGEDVLKLVKRLDDVTGVLFKARA